MGWVLDVERSICGLAQLEREYVNNLIGEKGHEGNGYESNPLDLHDWWRAYPRFPQYLLQPNALNCPPSSGHPS